MAAPANGNGGIEGTLGGVRFCAIRGPDGSEMQLRTIWVRNCTRMARIAAMVQKCTPRSPTQCG
jgi:hypothetical protein